MYVFLYLVINNISGHFFFCWFLWWDNSWVDLRRISWRVANSLLACFWRLERHAVSEQFFWIKILQVSVWQLYSANITQQKSWLNWTGRRAFTLKILFDIFYYSFTKSCDLRKHFSLQLQRLRLNRPNCEDYVIKTSAGTFPIMLCCSLVGLGTGGGGSGAYRWSDVWTRINDM